MPTINGHCHCGAVKFKASIAHQIQAHRCNCSICSMSGFLHVFVGGEDFELQSGQEALSEYRFNTGIARHLFCRHCGIKSFYVPRSHPQGYSLNLSCLELPDDVSVEILDFDGLHWEKHIDALHSHTA